MKNVLVVLLLVAAIAFVGCGKSAEMKKMETDLNAELMKMHDGQMAGMKQVGELVSSLDAALAKTDSLTAANPKLAEMLKTDDLKAAKEKLLAAKTGMESWMKGHKPYDVNMKHEEVLMNLKADKDALLKVKADGEAAIAGAGAALSANTAAVQDCLAKLAPVVAKKTKK